jgi:multidrug efflux pump subunit AcrA (membrane-fusion protein)
VPLGNSHDALLVTERALDSDQGNRVLYLVDKDNRVLSRPVRLGALHDGLREITEGLKPKERVLVNGLLMLRPGMTVEPSVVDMPSSKFQKTIDTEPTTSVASMANSASPKSAREGE